ncbi:hypothetical protein PVAP13_8NG195601 [Panicum virgatum]|uniref:Uncharacterized protein n=1 Tax=Panicum virgatum TaxID=38727 RepID=A0A8T0P6I6_PANVG|nr:hypothetical protein PVAP13_8NG195601 [Panicum virgatum]
MASASSCSSSTPLTHVVPSRSGRPPLLHGQPHRLQEARRRRWEPRRSGVGRGERPGCTSSRGEVETTSGEVREVADGRRGRRRPTMRVDGNEVVHGRAAAQQQCGASKRRRPVPVPTPTSARSCDSQAPVRTYPFPGSSSPQRWR